ncbi:MAG: hypothetical protein WEA29_06880 [Acidimicrobiia bacterium]
MTHHVGIAVGHKLAVDEVIPRLGPVDPLALLHRSSHAHHHVLGELLPVELCERTEHVVEHAPGRRRQIEALGERVQRDVGLPEGVGEQDEVPEVP